MRLPASYTRAFEATPITSSWAFWKDANSAMWESQNRSPNSSMRPCSSRMSRESRSFGIVETSVRVHVDAQTGRRVLAHKQDGVVPESDTCRDAPRGRRMPTQRGADGACPVARSGGSPGALARRRSPSERRKVVRLSDRLTSTRGLAGRGHRLRSRPERHEGLRELVPLGVP